MLAYHSEKNILLDKSSSWSHHDLNNTKRNSGKKKKKSKDGELFQALNHRGTPPHLAELIQSMPHSKCGKCIDSGRRCWRDPRRPPGLARLCTWIGTLGTRCRCRLELWSLSSVFLHSYPSVSTTLLRLNSIWKGIVQTKSIKGKKTLFNHYSLQLEN